MEKAPFFDKQPTDAISEIICLIGTQAWTALGYDKQSKRAKGEDWQLLCQALGRKPSHLPLVIGASQLNSMHQIKLTDTQKVIRLNTLLFLLRK